MELSTDFNDWISFSSYYNNFIAPILTFITVVILLYTLYLQNKENRKLREKEQKSEKTNEFLSLLSMKEKVIENISMMDFRKLDDHIHTDNWVHSYAAMSEALLIHKEFISTYLDEKLSFINEDNTLTKFGCMEEKITTFIPNSFRGYYFFMKSMFLCVLENNTYGIETSLAILNANITRDEKMILATFFRNEMEIINSIYEKKGIDFQLKSTIEAQHFVYEKFKKLIDFSKNEKKKKRGFRL